MWPTTEQPTRALAVGTSEFRWPLTVAPLMGSRVVWSPADEDAAHTASAGRAATLEQLVRLAGSAEQLPAPSEALVVPVLVVWSSCLAQSAGRPDLGVHSLFLASAHAK